MQLLALKPTSLYVVYTHQSAHISVVVLCCSYMKNRFTNFKSYFKYKYKTAGPKHNIGVFISHKINKSISILSICQTNRGVLRHEQLFQGISFSLAKHIMSRRKTIGHDNTTVQLSQAIWPFRCNGANSALTRGQQLTSSTRARTRSNLRLVITWKVLIIINLAL